MKLYEIIYNFIKSEIFTHSDLEDFTFQVFGNTIDMSVWLSHTTTIILMGLFIFILIIFLKLLFKICSNLFLLR